MFIAIISVVVGFVVGFLVGSKNGASLTTKEDAVEKVVSDVKKL